MHWRRVQLALAVGTALRRLLLVSGTHKWNAWVRDYTALLERVISPPRY